MNAEMMRNMLKNYRGYLRSREELKERIDLLEYRETNVKGIDYSRIPTKANPEAIAMNRLGMIENKDELEKELMMTEMAIEFIERRLNLLCEEDRKLVMDIYCDRVGIENIANRMGYEKSTIWCRAMRNIELMLKLPTFL